jgi:hypothetical protein
MQHAATYSAMPCLVQWLRVRAGALAGSHGNFYPPGAGGCRPLSGFLGLSGGWTKVWAGISEAELFNDAKDKKQGAAGITTAAPHIAGQWGRGDNRLPE